MFSNIVTFNAHELSLKLEKSSILDISLGFEYDPG